MLMLSPGRLSVSAVKFVIIRDQLAKLNTKGDTPLVSFSSVVMFAAFVSSDILNMSEDLLHSSCDSCELQDSGSEFSVMGEIWCLEEPRPADTDTPGGF